MRRIARAAALVAGLAALPLPSAVAADGTNANPGETEIHLNQTATRSMAPDRLRAVLQVEAKGSAARAVQSDVNKRMAAALDKARSVSAVKAETGGYSVMRDFNVKDREQWLGSETLTLSSQDFDAVLALVGDLQGMGLVMSELQFFVAPETLKAAESDLTASALADLKTRAAAVAKDLGMAVDHYKSITIGNANEGSQPIPRMFAAASISAMAPPVAQPGEVTASLTVNADIVLTSSKP